MFSMTSPYFLRSKKSPLSQITFPTKKLTLNPRKMGVWLHFRLKSKNPRKPKMLYYMLPDLKQQETPESLPANSR
jgi:hypothetical protein